LRGAAADADIAAVDALIAEGVPVDEARADGATALHLAVLGGHLDVVKRLLAAVADVRAKIVKSGLTPLHFAAQTDRTDIARVLVGAGAHVEARSTLGSTPLHVATRNRGLATIDFLIERGAEAGSTLFRLAKEASQLRRRNRARVPDTRGPRFRGLDRMG